MKTLKPFENSFHPTFAQHPFNFVEQMLANVETVKTGSLLVVLKMPQKSFLVRVWNMLFPMPLTVFSQAFLAAVASERRALCTKQAVKY